MRANAMTRPVLQTYTPQLEYSKENILNQTASTIQIDNAIKLRQLRKSTVIVLTHYSLTTNGHCTEH